MQPLVVEGGTENVQAGKFRRRGRAEAAEARRLRSAEAATAEAATAEAVTAEEATAEAETEEEAGEGREEETQTPGRFLPSPRSRS